jgi:hypothetical protein
MPSFFKHKKDNGSKSPAEGEHASRIQGFRPEPAATRLAAIQAVQPQDNNTPRMKVARDIWYNAFTFLPQDDCEALQPAGRDGKPSDAISQQAAVKKVMELTKVKYE